MTNYLYVNLAQWLKESPIDDFKDSVVASMSGSC